MKKNNLNHFGDIVDQGLERENIDIKKMNEDAFKYFLEYFKYYIENPELFISETPSTFDSYHGFGKVLHQTN